MKSLYVNFGCGTFCPQEFTNYDGSFNLRMQRNLLLGTFARKLSAVHFPANALYADIVKGLPVKENSLKGIFSSHVLEHLSLEEMRISLRNCYKYLQPGGIFRSVLPNLQEAIENYGREKSNGNKRAAYDFMNYTFLGYEKRPASVKDLVKWRLSGHHHFWMWDYESLEIELIDAGFSKVYRSKYNASEDPYFNYAESKGRFDYNALCFEAIK
jgi:predicted SAM-dependent methyltransferase